jgi:nucleoside-diphosphate-sugar epimerase
LNLLLGSTGFVGGHLAEYLFQQGEISKGVFRRGSHLKIMDSTGVQGIEADLIDPHGLHEAMEGVESVYNLASPMPGSDTDFLAANTEGVLNLLEVAKEAKVKTLVHLSTLDVYGFRAKDVSPSTPFNPSYGYQKSKAEGERLLQEFSKRNSQPRIAVIRSAKAIGSRDESLVVPILRMIEAGKLVLPAGSLMSYAHPRDISQAMYRAALARLPTGRVFLVKSFDSTPEGVGRGIASSLGRRVEVKKQGILSGRGLSKYTSEQLRASLRIDEQPSWKELGYAPVYDLNSTCEEIANWYRREPWVVESA